MGAALTRGTGSPDVSPTKTSAPPGQPVGKFGATSDPGPAKRLSGSNAKLNGRSFPTLLNGGNGWKFSTVGHLADW